MTPCTYLLPIRRTAFSREEAADLREYFASLGKAGCEVLVIDGSPSEIFSRHGELWSNVTSHATVDRQFGHLNDKVNGIQTGVRLARSEKIVLADDDIRYSAENLDAICTLLERFDVVRPQNYFRWNGLSQHVAIDAAVPPKIYIALGEHDPPLLSSLPWWAKLEAARMLTNRATLRHADYPGTCAFRRSAALSAGQYDGDVLFDNEEIIRHFARCGARICYANDLFIRKCPPNLRKWLEQRPRQAYEDFGLRFKTVLFASLLPIAMAIAIIDVRYISIFLLSILLAALGWGRGRARKYFPFRICFFAPLWIFERTLSTYWAFYWFVTRGGYPFGDRLLTKGIGRDWIEGGKIAAASRK